MRVVDVLPFVPTTWIAGYASCGSPSEASSPRIRPTPNSSGQGERLSSQATPLSAVECLELTAVALELRALALDDLSRRLLDEALVREHAFRPFDLLPQPFALGLDGAVGARTTALRLHDRVEDPLLVPLERDEPAPAAGRPPGGLDAVHRLGRRRVTLAHLGPGPEDQSGVVELGPDLLGDVRQDRVEQRQQALERGKCRRDHRRVVGVEP